jgi:glycerophosphoryl diester phosphodiesterase
LTILSPAPSFQIIGHRGVAGLAPENTLAGFKLAKQRGLNWVEFDTQPCLTGEWVVFHDETLERTTNGFGSLAKTPYANLQHLDAGSWFNFQYHQERIPLLSEVLDTLIRLNLQPNIEIKGLSNPQHAQPLINFLQILNHHWPKSSPPPLISSFDLPTLLALKKLDPRLCLGYLVEGYQPDTLEIMRSNEFFSLHCDATHICSSGTKVSSDALLDIVRAGFPLLLYTVNDPLLAQMFFEQGVTAVFSDLTNLIAESFPHY